MGIPTIPKRFQGLNIKCVQDTACYRFCEECHPLKCGLLQLLLQGYRAGINHAQRRNRPDIILIILLVFSLAWAIASYLGSKEKDAVAMRSKHVPRDPLVETLVAMDEGRLERQQSETVHEPFLPLRGSGNLLLRQPWRSPHREQGLSGDQKRRHTSLTPQCRPLSPVRLHNPGQITATKPLRSEQIGDLDCFR